MTFGILVCQDQAFENGNEKKMVDTAFRSLKMRS
jgi:hypothetical protein